MMVRLIERLDTIGHHVPMPRSWRAWLCDLYDRALGLFDA